MSKKVYSLLLLFICFCLTSNTVFGQNANYYQSFVILNTGSGNTYYDAGVATGNADFNGNNLGTYSCNGTLVLNGGETDIRKGGGCDVTSSKLAYRIYLQGSAVLPAFSEITLPFSQDFGSCFSGNTCQRWMKNDAGVNILTGLADGTYKIEVYFVGATQFCSVGPFFDSNFGNNYSATFTISNPITLVTSPTTPTICYGSNTSLSASATGSDAFIWQKQNGANWDNLTITGATGNLASGATTTLNLTNVTTTETYRCLFTNCGGINTKPSASVIVTGQRPAITVQPVNAIDCQDRVTYFYIGASNVDYQWQRKRASDLDFVDLTDVVTTDVTGTATNYLKIDKAGSANNLDGTLYRCKITSKTTPFCTNTSSVVSLSVNNFNTNTVATSPVCVGNSVTFTSNIASGAARLQSYQWYKGGVSSPVSGANSAAFTTVINLVSENSWGVQGVFQNNTTSSAGVTTTGTCVNNQTSSITVRALPSAPTVTNAARCGTGAITVSASGAVSGQNYKWYANNVSTTPIQTNGASYATNLTTTTDYYVSIYSTSLAPFCEGTRVKVTATINENPTITLGSVTDICNNLSTFDLPFSSTTGSPNEYTISAGVPLLTGFSTITNTLGSSPISVAIPANSVANTYQFGISVKNTITGCFSSAQNFNVKIKDTPAAPTVATPINYCQNATTTALSATATNTLLWYGTDATGGTSSASAPTPSAASVGTVTYYVSQKTTDNCESSRAAIAVVTNAIPAVPATYTSINYCKNAVATALSATTDGSNTLIWYDANDNILASAPTPNTGTVGTLTYKVSQKSPSPANCEGAKAIITVTINDLPLAPTVTSPIGYCQNATASALSATATGNLLWYGTDATGGTSSASAPTPSTTSAGTISYYVSQKDGNNCESPRAKIDVEITPTLTGTVSGVNAFCITGVLNNSTTLTANPTGGNGTFTYQWQNLAGNITSATNSTFVTSTANTYKTVITSGYCTFTTATFAVTEQGWNDTPSVTGNTPDICGSGSKTLNIVSPNASGTYKWFADATTLTETSSGTSYATPSLSAMTTYYVAREQAVTGSLTCQTNRTAVTINVVAIPLTPTIVNSANKTTFCNTESSFTLSVTCSSGSGQYRLNSGSWTAGNSVSINPATYPTAATFTYDFKCVVSATCESSATSTSITVNPAPAAPSISGNTSFCTGGSTTLTANACTGTVIWSNGITANGITVSVAGTYNATCTVNGCVSPVSTLQTVVENALPSFATNPTDQTNCSGNSVTFTATTAASATLQWEYRTSPTSSFANVGSSVIGTSNPLSVAGVGSATYPDGSEFRLKATSNTCLSNSSSAFLHVNSVAGTMPQPTACAGSNITFDLLPFTIVGTVTSYQWQSSSSESSGYGNNGLPTGNTLTLNNVSSANGNLYYACVITFTKTGGTGTCIERTDGGKPTITTITPPTISGATAICAGSSTSLTASGCAGTVIWSNGVTANSITVSVAGTYNATCTQSGCTSLASNVHTLAVNSIPARPTVTSNDVDNTVCAGTDVVLTASDCTGTVIWSNGLTANSITVSVAGTYNATCTVNGCVSAVSILQTIIVNAIPTKPTISGSTSICAGSSTTLTASDCTGTVIWSNSVTANSITVSVAGTYNATCTVNDCVSAVSDLQTITINAIPAKPTISGSTSICAGSSTTLTASDCTGTVIWSNGVTANSITVSSAGTYNATCTVNGCVSAVSELQTIIVNPIPAKPTVTSSDIDNTVCAGTDVVLTASDCTGTVIWSNGITANTITVSASGTYNATCTVNSCVSAVSTLQTVVINAIPSFTIQPSNQTNCKGLSSTFSATVNISSTLQWEYRKVATDAFGNVGSATTSTTASFSASNIGSATYPHGSEFRLKATSNGCVKYADIATLNVNSVTGDIPDQVKCNGASTTFDLTALNIVGTISSYQWEVSETAGGTYINVAGSQFSGANTNILTINPIGANDGIKYYRCKMVFTNTASGTCTITSNSGKLTVTTITPPTISGATAICSGSATTLTASGCAGTVTWNTSAVGNTISASLSGTYSATCTQSGCTSLASGVHTLVVNSIPARPTVTSNDVDNTVCAGTDVVLTASDCTGIVIWSNGVTANSITVSASGTYNATCTVNNCVSVASVLQTVVVNAIPAKPTISGSTSICSGNATTLTANGCTGTVVWNTGITANTLNVSVAGTYNATCTVNNCTSLASDGKVITVNSIPSAPTITGSTVVCQGSSTTLTASGCAGTITWNTAATGNTVSASIGTYSATCTENSCTSSASATHTISENPIPTITLTAVNSICNAATTFDLPYSTTANSPDKYSLTATMPDFVAVSETNLPLSTISIIIPSGKTGSHTFTLSIKNTTCVNSQTFSVTILPVLIGGSIEVSPNTTNCAGYTPPSISSVTLASGGKTTYTYQWQNSTDGTNFADISGANLSAFTPTASLTQTTYFRRKVTDACGIEAFSSNSHQITIVPDPQITLTDASERTICSGENINLGATLSGGFGTCTPTWQSSDSPSSGFVAEQSGGLAFNKTLTNATSVPIIKYFRVIYACSGTGSGSCNQATSAVVKVTINYIPNAPTITPASVIICPTQSTTLTASGCSGTISWAGGQTGSTLLVSTSGSYIATCTINNCKSDVSLPAVVTVASGGTLVSPPTIIGTASICNGQSTSLTATGCTGLVTWSDGKTGANISVNPSISTNYTATCNDGTCTSNVSNEITVTVNNYPTISTQPKNDADCNGNSVTFSVSASPATAYQWQRKIPNGSFTDIATATTNSLTISDVGSVTDPNQTQYQVTVSNASCSVTSTVAVLTVNSVAGNLADKTICESTNTTFDLTGITTTGTIQSYQWQKRIGTSGTWNDIVGATTTSLTINAATNADEQYYRLKINFTAGSSTCARYTTEDDTNGAKLTVLVASTPNISGNNAICLGKSTILTSNSCDGTISWSSGQTTSTITVSPTVSTSYTVTCASTQCNFTATSVPYSVAVNSTPQPLNNTYDVITPQTLVFSATTTVTNATLMWYNRATGGTATSIAPVFTAVGTYSYWVTQTDPITGCESARLPVIAKVLDYFHIITQPSKQVDCKGNSVYMDVTAVSPSSLFTYQWQRKRPNEADFTNLTIDGNGIKGWYAKTMVVSNVGDDDNPNQTQYRCIISSNGQFLVSDATTLTVNSLNGLLPNLGTCAGSNTNFNLSNYFTITGNVLSYQWQTRPGTSGTWTNLEDGNGISGSLSKDLKFTNVRYEQGVYYRCLVKFNTQGFECTEPTDAGQLIVSGFPPTPAVSDIFYCQFARSAKLKVNSASQNLVWYTQATGGEGSTIAPTPNTAIAGVFFYYVADQTDQGCQSPRVAIKVDVGVLPPAPINTTPSSVNEGSVLTFSADGSPKEGQVLHWFNTPTGTTFTTANPTFSAVGTYTRYVAQLSAYSCLGPRTAITASIIPNLKFTKQPISQADCDGNSVTFNVTATAPNAFSYQWQRQKPNENIFTDIQNEITNSLKISNIGNIESPHLTKYRCIIKNEKNTVISEETVLTVNEIKNTLANISLCDGKTAKLSFNNLVITGNVISYQWQKKEGSIYTDVVTNQDGIANVNEIGTYRGRVIFAIDNKTTCARNTDDLKIDVKPVPSAPQVFNQAICQNTTFNLEKSVISSNTLFWYDTIADSTGDKNAPKIDLSKASKTTFYVSQITQFGCESERKTFDLLISAIPAKPIVSDLNYCRNAPIVSLTAATDKENSLVWYASNTTNVTINTPTPDTKTDGTTSYFVGAKNAANCESSRSEIKVNVAPCIATFDNNFNNCLQVSADGVKGNQWYDIYDNAGKLYASVNPNGLDLGKVSASIKHYGRGSGAIPATKNDTKFMARYIDFQSALLKNFEKPVSLRIYYQNAELNEYKTATNLPNLTINDFNIVHYDGKNEDCGFENNDNFNEGNSVVIYKNVVGNQIAKDFFYLQFDVNEFSENGATANDFTEITFSGKETADKMVNLNWQTKFEVKAEKFILERSTDCQKWVSLGEIKANGINSNYEKVDSQPLSGKSCYRLVYVDKDGTKKYLDPIEVNFTDTTPICSVFPNPWTMGDEVKLYLRNIKEKEIKLYDLIGQEYSFDLEKDELGIIHIRPDSYLTKGTHFVVITGEDGKRCIQKVVINP